MFEVLVLKAKYSLDIVCPVETDLIANNANLSKTNITESPSEAKNLPENILNSLHEAYQSETSESGEQDTGTPISKQGYQLIRTGQSPVISFTLFAFIIGQFATFESSQHLYEGWPLKLHCLIDDKLKLAKYSSRMWKITETGLKFYEDYFACKMPYSKLDQVFIPRFRFNGMENPGCIFLSNNNLEQQNRLFMVFNRDRLLLHEIGHMWLGNLISMNQFHNIWLKESCVEYFCHKAFEHVFPAIGSTLKPDDCLSNLIIRGASTFPSEQYPFKVGSYPLCFSQEAYQDHIVDYYGRIVYQKGSTYIRSLELLLGSEIFKILFRTLMASFKETNYSDEDFKHLVHTLIKQHGSEELLGRFNSWFQDHIHLNGYNVFKVDKFTWEAATKTLQVTIDSLYMIWGDIQFSVYSADGKSLSTFKWNPRAAGNNEVLASTVFSTSGHNLAQVVLTISGIETQPAAVVPNSDFNGLMLFAIDQQSFNSLFTPRRATIHDLPQVERTVIYQSVMYDKLAPKFAQQNWIQAAAISDASPYLAEVFANNVRDAHSDRMRTELRSEGELN